MKYDFISKPDLDILLKKYKEDELDELLKSTPVQYLIGNVDFLNCKINVDKRVLIPRFETEMLVDETIKIIKKKFNKTVNIIDLGTGSGCIAVALKKNIDAFVTALDVSEDALDVAKKNALENNVDITFIKQSMEDELKDNYDCIISNPPYIPEGGYVQKIVKENEPSLALYASKNGIYYYEVILKKHLKSLNKPGLIAFEIGDNQEELLNNLIKQYKIKYEFKKDLQGLTRYLFIYNE